MDFGLQCAFLGLKCAKLCTADVFLKSKITKEWDSTLQIYSNLGAERARFELAAFALFALNSLILRRERDSNSRTGFAGHTLSRRALSPIQVTAIQRFTNTRVCLLRFICGF